MRSWLRRNSSRSLVKEGKEQSVKFDLSQSSTQEITHLDDLPEDYVGAVWYSEEEYLQMKDEMKPVVHKMMKGLVVEETDDSTTRGLECRTKVGSRARLRLRRQSVSCVLEEQEIQLEEGVPDPEFIANLYSDLTGVSAIEALNRGLKDQRFMMENLDPELQAERELRSKSEKILFDRSPIKKKPRPSLSDHLSRREMAFPR